MFNFYKLFKKKFCFRKNATYPKSMLFFPFMILPKIAKMNSELDIKDITLGEYENRIRNFASIEKRFLVFANVHSKDDLKMNYFQFLHNLVPYQYIKIRDKKETEEILTKNKFFQEILHRIDINKDGFINFEEFVILCIVLNLSNEKFIEKMKKEKYSKEDLAELIMDEASKNIKITNKSIFDGRSVKTDYNTLYKYCVEFLSKEYKKETLTYNDFFQTKTDLFVFMLFYEFYRIPETKPNHISMENFAKVILSYIDVYKNSMVKKRIENKEIDLSVI